MIDGMGRIPFFVSTLLAFALVATVLAVALLAGLIAPGGQVAVASPTPASSSGFPSSAPTATPVVTPEPTLPPTPTPFPSGGGTYLVQPGDYLTLIADNVHVPWQLIAEANNIQGPDYVIVPGQLLIIPAIPVPSGVSDYYVVEPGDTIIAIAALYDVDATALADFNNVVDWNSIRPGDILYIPGPGWTPLPTANP